MSKMPPTKEEALAVLKTCEGYENIVLQEDESGWLSGTHPNGCPVRIVGSDENGWFEVHGGICGKWLDPATAIRMERGRDSNMEPFMVGPSIRINPKAHSISKWRNIRG